MISYVQNNSNRNKGEMDGWYVFNIIYPYVIQKEHKIPLRKISKNQKTKSTVVKNKGGDILMDEEEIPMSWKEYLEHLYE